MDAQPEILLVEDDAMIATALGMSLRLQGFALQTASSLHEARAVLARERFALILLDVGLPDGSGLDLCRELRASGHQMPILMLTARTDEATAVAGIDGGADDYVRKPYGVQELVARMRRLLARSAASQARARETLSFANLVLEPQRHEISVQGQTLRCPKREFEILRLLVRAQGDVVTREQILSSLEADSEIYDRTIDSHLSHLRRKLKEADAALRIVAIYGVGYRLESETAADAAGS